MKQSFETSLYQSCHLPMNLPANNTQQISSNVATSRPAQQILVSTPVPLPAPNQQAPLFINTNVPSRCTWVPPQPLLLRPINQTSIMPPSNLHLPQVQSQVGLATTTIPPRLLLTNSYCYHYYYNYCRYRC